jgi:hypothetical protein
VSFDAGGGSDSNEFGGWSHNGNVSISLKPLSSLTISTGPQLNRSRNVAQYIQTETDPAAAATYGHRYVFGTIDQTQLTLTTRVNFVLTRRASLQVFMQPLLATGAYSGFKELAAPNTFDFLRYGAAGSAIAYDPLSRVYSVRPDAGSAEGVFTFENPDFNFKSLRANAVFRWEFRPGSTLYAVWTSERQDFSRPGIFHFGRDLSSLLRAPSNDVVLVKLAYWIGR